MSISNPRHDGEVVAALDEDNHVRLDRLRQVIRDQGFTPRGAPVGSSSRTSCAFRDLP